MRGSLARLAKQAGDKRVYNVSFKMPTAADAAGVWRWYARETKEWCAAVNQDKRPVSFGTLAVGATVGGFEMGRLFYKSGHETDILPGMAVGASLGTVAALAWPVLLPGAAVATGVYAAIKATTKHT